MKIAYITAGAAGMFCGSCMHDNTLVAALRDLGHDALLIPTYTPIRTDEKDVSQHRVFFGGINVYLQQKTRFFRWTPWFFDRLLDFPRLLRWVSRFAVRTQADQLGDLTLSILRGAHGFQAKEIEKLLAFLEDEVQPDLLVLTNVLLSGIVPPLKKRWKIPILGTLQGDDIFLEALPPAVRRQAIELIRTNCQAVDGYLATSRYYADFMADYLDLPRDRMHVVWPGINLKGHGSITRSHQGTFTIGYFARICPEKGLHVLVEAFRHLRTLPGGDRARLKVSGWLGENNRKYLQDLVAQLQADHLSEAFEHIDSPDHARKVQFLQSIDVLSVPTVYQEPKGLYVLEAWANGVPVVQPRHGSFPELIQATGGGLLVEPGNPLALAQELFHLMNHPDQCRELGERGRQAVGSQFTARHMAERTFEVFGKYAP